MFYELPLVIFTVLAQAAVGAHLTVNGFSQFAHAPRLTSARLNIARFAILVVMGLGFVASTTHLGSPLRAFNALNRVGASALSNEIFTGSAFLALAGLYWLTKVTNFGAPALRRVINGLSIIMGVVFIFAMGKVYYIPTVPAWHTGFTFVEFWLTVVTLGLMFGFVLLNSLNMIESSTSRKITYIGCSLIALHLAVSLMQTLYFANLSTAIHSGLEQVSSLSHFVAGHIFLLVGTIAVWLYAEIWAQKSTSRTGLFITAFALLFIAEILGRNVFYGMHFTSGLY